MSGAPAKETRMTSSLPMVEVVRRYLDDDFDSRSPVVVMRWEETAGAVERVGFG